MNHNRFCVHNIFTLLIHTKEKEYLIYSFVKNFNIINIYTQKIYNADKNNYIYIYYIYTTKWRMLLICLVFFGLNWKNKFFIWYYVYIFRCKYCICIKISCFIFIIFFSIRPKTQNYFYATIIELGLWKNIS